MAERNYYVLCDSNCRFPAMTKEQTLAAIMQAVNEGTIGDIDAGFVTTIKTINGKSVRFFVGLQSEYEALTDEEKVNLFALITNDTMKEAFESAIASLRADCESFREGLIDGSVAIKSASYASTASYATHAGSASSASYATSAGKADEASLATRADEAGRADSAKKADTADYASSARKATADKDGLFFHQKYWHAADSETANAGTLKLSSDGFYHFLVKPDTSKDWLVDFGVMPFTSGTEIEKTLPVYWSSINVVSFVMLKITSEGVVEAYDISSSGVSKKETHLLHYRRIAN